MDARDRDVLNLLISNTDFCSTRALGEKLGMSRRALGHSLDAIDTHLLSRGLTPLLRVAGRGVRLDDDAHDALVLESAFTSSAMTQKSSLQFYEGSARRLLTCFAIACSSRRVGPEALASWEDVSARTVLSDIQVMREEYLHNGIAIKTDRQLGYCFDGDEFVLRSLLVREINSMPEASTIAGLYQLLNTLFCVVRGKGLPFGASALDEADRYIAMVLPGGYDASVHRNLIIHLILAASRRHNQSEPYGTAQDRAALSGTAYLEIARLLRLNAASVLNLNVADVEDWYFALLLRTLPVSRPSDATGEYPFEIEVVAQKLTALVGDECGCNFEDDPGLLASLVSHLSALSCRLLFNSQVENPLLDEIVSKYAHLHSVVRRALLDVEQATGRSITEDEIAFITLYFASSIEKITIDRRVTCSVVIVCNSGNAVSRLLQYRLASAFSMRIQATASVGELPAILANGTKPDLIVTVVDLDPELCPTIPVIKVSPLFTEEDRNVLKRHLMQAENASSCAQTEGPGLLDLIGEGRFALDVDVSALDDLIRFGGDLLCKSGLCSDDYVTDMVAAAHGFGPLTTILIAPGLIMPHARISDYVYQTGFSFVRCARPVIANGRPVSYALSLCTCDKRENQGAIKQLGLLLRGGDFLEGLRSIDTYQDFCRLVTRCLKKAEQEWGQC